MARNWSKSVPATAHGSPRALKFEPLESRLLLSGTGLTGQYFHNVDFTGLAAERIEAVHFNWGVAGPAAGVAPDGFSVRWTGQVEAPLTETYTFRTISDEGARLWVNGQLLIDAWAPHIERVDFGSIALTAGVRYDIRLEYFDVSGPARIQLEWYSGSQTLQTIPASVLYPSPAGLRGEYSDTIGGSAIRIDDAVDFAWGSGGPAPGVAADNFEVRWTGYIRPDFSDQYVFSTRSDDGVRVWIGDELVIDNWTIHAPTTNIGFKTLEAGKWYDIRVEYFEATGGAEIELQWSSTLQTGAGVFETIDGAHMRAARYAPITFTNPLGPGADPYVVQWEGKYLLVRSSGRSIRIDQAEQLPQLHANNAGSATVTAWTAPLGTNYSAQIWAPELHRIGDKWYIYVAASDGNNATHRMHVLERDADDPMGPFTYKGQLAASTDRWAIDGTVLQWQGQLYFLWSGWPGFTDGQQNLYIAAMSNPWTITGNRVRISEPTFTWERHGLPINEGPQVLIHDGQLHIIYSASGYWRHEYALGRLTYQGTGSLLDAASWSKAPTPVFKAAGDIVGTGHASFTKSPDGTEDWIVYHAHHDAYNWQDDRDILIQPFTYHANGTPNFGAPLPRQTAIAYPSGPTSADRPLLPADYNASGEVNGVDFSVFAAQFGQVVFPGSASDGDGSGTVDGLDFLMWQEHLGASAVAASELNAAELAAAREEPSSSSAGPASLAKTADGGRAAEISAGPITATPTSLASQLRTVYMPAISEPNTTPSWASIFHDSKRLRRRP